MKKLLIAALALTPLCANAQSLVVNLSDGQTVKYPISSITDLTFEMPVVQEPLDLGVFTDPVVREKLQAFDTDGDGVLSVEEQAEITSLDFSSSEVQSLAGLEKLPALAQLNLQSCQKLTGVDISEGFNALSFLQLGFCYNLESCIIGEKPALKELYVQYTKVAELNLDGATGLETLGTRDSKLTTLSITNSPELNYLSIGNDGLTTVEISGCDKMQTLSLAKATYIKDKEAMAALLAKFPVLENLSIESYPGTAITTEANPELLSLSLSQCGNLYTINVSKSLKLNTLTQYGSYELETVIMTEGQTIGTLSGISDYMIQRVPREYPEDVASTITNETFRQVMLNAADADKDGVITEEEARALTVLNAPDAGLTEVDFTWFPNIKTLNLSGNELESIDLGFTTLIEDLNLSNNNLTALDLSKLDALKVLDASHNDIAANIFKIGSSAIETADLSYNNLTVVQIYYKSHLTTLDLSHNNIVSYNTRVDQNDNLANLNVSYNQISELTIWSLKKLVNANFSNNPLIQLNEANRWTILETIDCSNTEIPTLDLSQTTKLTKCVATECPNLTTIYIGDNTTAEIVKDHNTEVVPGAPAAE